MRSKLLPRFKNKIGKDSSDICNHFIEWCISFLEFLTVILNWLKAKYGKEPGNFLQCRCPVLPSCRPLPELWLCLNECSLFSLKALFLLPRIMQSISKRQINFTCKFQRLPHANSIVGFKENFPQSPKFSRGYSFLSILD